MTEKNPYEPDDIVELLVDVRDSYNEIKHLNGDILDVKYISRDGKGVIFSSELGVHFSKVKLIKKKTIFCQQTANSIQNNLIKVLQDDYPKLGIETHLEILNILSQAIELSK